MELHITMLNGTSSVLCVQPDHTVGSLKTLIESKFGVDASMQRLIYNNGQTTTLDDVSRSLSSYGLRSGSKVSLLIIEATMMQVFLRNEKGQTKTHRVNVNITVEEFKTKVQKEEGVPVSQQRLIHEGKEMMQGKLSDYEVKELSTIYLTFRLRGG